MENTAILDVMGGTSILLAVLLAVFLYVPALRKKLDAVFAVASSKIAMAQFEMEEAQSGGTSKDTDAVSFKEMLEQRVADMEAKISEKDEK